MTSAKKRDKVSIAITFLVFLGAPKECILRSLSNLH